MKIKKLLYTALTALNILSLTGTLVLTVIGSSLAKSQSYNGMADRWDSKGGYSQISCFFSDDSGLTTDNIGGVKTNALTSLKNISIIPEENQKLVSEAYSTPAGQITIRSDTTSGHSEAELTAVGGDFFMFRDFNLLDGSYFTDDDLMQDGVVIDRTLAWSLYGAQDVSGMNIYINGIKFYIAGVIDNPQTKQEKRTIGELPRAYVSYGGAGLLDNSSSVVSKVPVNYKGSIVDNDGIMPSDTGLKKISCYECIMPNPVENYAYNTVNDYFKDTYKNKYTIVNNSERFNPSVRAKSFKNLSDYAAVENSVVYPYWENASRIIEFKLTTVYFYRRLTYIIPVLTVLWLLILLWRAAGRLRNRIIEWTGDKITRIIYNHNQRQKKKKENI
ncbi:MAG: ABC transporter permease [Ruminococcus sp.]|nr:ABC transporter permease [Ruminococcus sp.]